MNCNVIATHITRHCHFHAIRSSLLWKSILLTNNRLAVVWCYANVSTFRLYRMTIHKICNCRTHHDMRKKQNVDTILPFVNCNWKEFHENHFTMLKYLSQPPMDEKMKQNVELQIVSCKALFRISCVEICKLYQSTWLRIVFVFEAVSNMTDGYTCNN